MSISLQNTLITCKHCKTATTFYEIEENFERKQQKVYYNCPNCERRLGEFWDPSLTENKIESLLQITEHIEALTENLSNVMTDEELAEAEDYLHQSTSKLRMLATEEDWTLEER